MYEAKNSKIFWTIWPVIQLINDHLQICQIFNMFEILNKCLSTLNNQMAKFYVA